MSLILYPYSVDNATITYEETHDTDYGEERLNDRNRNDLFKDSAIGSVDLYLDFDLGAGITRKADHLILGNYKSTTTGGNGISYWFYYSDNGSNWTSAKTAAFTEASNYSDFYATFTETEAAHRYWRFYILDQDTPDNLGIFELGNVFFGSKIEISKGYNLNTPEQRSYPNIVSENLSGNRFSQLYNTNDRAIWSYTLEYLSTTDRTNLISFADAIYAGEQLSHYPFYFSPDSGTTLYFARMRGPLQIIQKAYQAYECTLTFEEEL